MLTPRLKCIYSHIRGKTVADIGTDHAYIPISLAENGRIDRAYACDIRQGPCDIAKANIKNAGFENIIEVRMGSGLSVIRVGEAEDIVIAGMGGILISDIINAHIETARASRLVLQPMNSQNELRRFLYENEFCIEDEDLAQEGCKLYNVITAVYKQGTQKSCKNEIDLHIPPILTDHPLFDKLIEKKHREFSKILKGLYLSNEDHIEKIAAYELLDEQLKNRYSNYFTKKGR